MFYLLTYFSEVADVAATMRVARSIRIPPQGLKPTQSLSPPILCQPALTALICSHLLSPLSTPTSGSSPREDSDARLRHQRGTLTDRPRPRSRRHHNLADLVRQWTLTSLRAFLYLPCPPAFLYPPYAPAFLYPPCAPAFLYPPCPPAFLYLPYAPAFLYPPCPPAADLELRASRRIHTCRRAYVRACVRTYTCVRTRTHARTY